MRNAADGLSLGIGLPELLLRWFRQPAYPWGNPEHLIWQDRAVYNVKFQKVLWVNTPHRMVHADR